jgi:hypothetical protein
MRSYETCFKEIEEDVIELSELLVIYEHFYGFFEKLSEFLKVLLCKELYS